MKFKLLQGGHSEDYTTQSVDAEGKTINVVHAEQYHARDNNIIESKNDLCKLFNAPGYPPKFERISDDATPSKGISVSQTPDLSKNKNKVTDEMRKADEEELKSMTVQELKNLSAEQGIDIKDAHKKDDIIATILLHREAAGE